MQVHWRFKQYIRSPKANGIEVSGCQCGKTFKLNKDVSHIYHIASAIELSHGGNAGSEIWHSVCGQRIHK